MSQAVHSGVPPTAPPGRSPWMRWQMVAMLVSFSFMSWFNRVSMPVAYDVQIKQQSGISPEDMGWVYSALLFSYMVCMTPGGWLIDRFGPWAALAVMGLGTAVFGALTGIAGLPLLVAAGLLLPALFVIRSLMGILSAPVYPASSRIVANWVPVSQRARANGLVQGAAAVGIACTFPVFGALVDRFDWQIAFVISGAVTGLLALAWLVFGSDYPASHRFNSAPAAPAIAGDAPAVSPASVALPAPWWTLLANRSLMLLTLSYAAVGYVEYLFFFWMHYYFKDVLKLGAGHSRTYAAILTLAMAAGMVLGGWAGDRLRMRHGGRGSIALVPALGLCAGAAFMMLGVLAHEPVWIVTLLALALAAIGATEAPVWTMAVELGKHHGGTAAAICNTGGNAGMLAPIVTPWVSGWITRNYGVSELAGWQWGIGLGSAIAVLGAILWFWITPDQPGDSPR